MVKIRPIVFDGVSVRAILAGRKTQTRRVVKPQPDGEVKCQSFLPSLGEWLCAIAGGAERVLRSPHGTIGDALWVRETWAPALAAHGECWKYRAGGNYHCGKLQPDGLDVCTTWRPPIYMPRSASRIMLEITGVRVERVHSISRADIRAEGISDDDRIAAGSYRAAWAQRWDDINGKKHPWASDPWVFAISFRKV